MKTPALDGHGSSTSVSPNGQVPTFFAPPERSGGDELRAQLDYLEHDPVVDAMMRAVAGLVAVLNEQRQVLALNTRMLELLGIADPGKALGLRLGEVVGCTHSSEMPGGCGTSEYCSTCGAAISQVTSLQDDQAVERTCAIDLRHPLNGAEQIFFRVQACPIHRGPRRVLLLFLQDISAEQQRAALDRTFFHDVRNTLCGVLNAGEILARDRTRPDASLAAALVQSAHRLFREIELQRCLSTSTMERFERMQTPVAVSDVLEEAARIRLQHPEITSRTLEITPADAGAPLLHTDPTLLFRVVQNMVVNACEATPPGGRVRVWVDVSPEAVAFCVWNPTAIPPEVARRVFQRNFSTKATLGRGLGTYSMKLLGERMLGGNVGFTSNAAEGTCFRFRLPVAAG